MFDSKEMHVFQEALVLIERAWRSESRWKGVLHSTLESIPRHEPEGVGEGRGVVVCFSWSATCAARKYPRSQ